MRDIYLFLAEGFEEIEALTVVDLARRAGLTCDMVSVTDNRMVTGSHGIAVQADLLFEEAEEAKAICLPGGMPGTKHLLAHEGLKNMILRYREAGRLLSAICAAPTVFGTLGLLSGKRAICYPGMEDRLTGATVVKQAVVEDGQLITSRGMGTAIEFGLALVARLAGGETAEKLAAGIVYTDVER